jgi:soluble lytic murein transglycosylase-like protein
MSLVAVATRVQELQRMITPAAPPAATAAPTTSGFAAQLSAASATTAPTATAASAAPGSNPYDAEIMAAAQRNGVDPALLRNLVRAESGFDPHATSGAGAMGLCQLMPGTAAGLGVTDPYDPVQSLEGGARYLRKALDQFGGDTAKALAAYNAGPGAVQKYGGVPPYAETQAYVQKIMGWMAQDQAATGVATL